MTCDCYEFDGPSVLPTYMYTILHEHMHTLLGVVV